MKEPENLTETWLRLKEFVKLEFGGNFSAFARKINMNPTQIGVHKRRKEDLPFSYKEAVEEAGLNWKWYITGKGEMLLNQDKKKLTQSIVSEPDEEYNSGQGNTKEIVELVRKNLQFMTVREVHQINKMTKAIAELIQEENEEV